MGQANRFQFGGVRQVFGRCGLKQGGHLTSHLSGPRDVPKSLAFAALILCQTFRAITRPLNSSVMQNREVQNPKAKPDSIDSWIRESLVWWGVLFSGDFSSWFLKHVKMVVTSFCLFFLCACISRWVSNFTKLVFIGFKNQ